MENTEYNEMTVYELKAVQQELASQFEEYKRILSEVYNAMGELSDEYNKITEIINQKNGQ